MSASPLSADLIRWGAVLKPAVVAPGQTYWRLVHADGPKEWGGRVSVYVDLRNEDGVRVVGTNVVFYWRDGQDKKPTEAKAGEPFAVDFPMNAKGNSYGIRVDGGIPSDDIFGFGLGSFVPHHVFTLIYYLATAGGTIDTGPQVPPIPSPNTSVKDALEQAQKLIDYARGLLP